MAVATAFRAAKGKVKKRKMIRNIVFDMGGVLIRFDPPHFIQRLGITGEDAALLHREVFRTVEWVKLDRGTITEEEAVARMCVRVPSRLHDAVEKLVTMWDRPILPFEGMAELIGELKAAGYGIYLLSNAFARQHEYWPRVPGSEYFDDTLISADVKLIKPDHAIYRMMLEKFGLRGEECVFIDDLPANIEAAVDCGLSGVVFHGDAAILRRDLRRLGIKVSE